MLARQINCALQQGIRLQRISVPPQRLSLHHHTERLTVMACTRLTQRDGLLCDRERLAVFAQCDQVRSLESQHLAEQALAYLGQYDLAGADALGSSLEHLCAFLRQPGESVELPQGVSAAIQFHDARVVGRPTPSLPDVVYLRRNRRWRRVHSWLGDINADACADLAIGTPGSDGGAGRVSIITGRGGNWPVPPNAEAIFDSTTSFVGAPGAGDVNGDGFADVLIGAGGAAYLVLGHTGAWYSSANLADEAVAILPLPACLRRTVRLTRRAPRSTAAIGHGRRRPR